MVFTKLTIMKNRNIKQSINLDHVHNKSNFYFINSNGELVHFVGQTSIKLT